MPMNLALDDKLIIQAQKIGNRKTKKEAVIAAIREYISQEKLLSR